MTVLGVSEVMANLARIVGEIETDTAGALHDGAEIVRDAWVANIEGEDLVLTGRYRDSVQVVEGDDGKVGVTTDVPYAAILEDGDSRQAGHHVAERAFDEHHDDALERIGTKIAERLR